LGELTSCQALSFKNDWICALLQSYTRKPTLILGKLEKKGAELEVKWTFCETEPDTSLSDLVQVELVKFKPNLPNPNFPNLDFEAILVKPKSSNNMLISFPHGGPHSAFSSGFSTQLAVFYSLGYSILLINYRGSSNYGQDCINSLPGHIGTYDVSDCQVNIGFLEIPFFRKAFSFVSKPYFSFKSKQPRKQAKSIALKKFSFMVARTVAFCPPSSSGNIRTFTRPLLFKIQLLTWEVRITFTLI
jgi:hypothetical protein